MKAVRGVEGGVKVVDLDEPPGIGELLQIKSASVCGSDLSYLTFGTRAVLGHELAGVREDGTAGSGRGDLRLHGVRAVPVGRLQPVSHPRRSARSASAPTAACRSSSARPTARLVPFPRASICATPRWSSPPRCRGTRCGSPTPGRARRVAVVGAGRPWPARGGRRPAHGCRRRRHRGASSPSDGGR